MSNLILKLKLYCLKYNLRSIFKIGLIKKTAVKNLYAFSDYVIGENNHNYFYLKMALKTSACYQNINP